MASSQLSAGAALALIVHVAIFTVLGTVFISNWINRYRNRVENAYNVLKIKGLTPHDVNEVTMLLNRLSERFKPIDPKLCRLARYAKYPPYNLELVNSCVTDIAEYLGLTGLTFIVQLQELNTNTAGRINMIEHNGCITVCIASSLLDKGDALVVALCHEVMHKFLEKVGLTDLLVEINEKLTDVSCIFFGMGQLFMNTCIWYEEYDTREGFLLTTHKKAQRIGYLLPAQIALAYDLCVQRLGRKLDDSPKELNGMASAIFEQYRDEIKKLAKS